MYEPPAHLGPVSDDAAVRDRFEPPELAMVLSHYELDVITSIREFPFGSRRSPKLRITTRSGEYLLKRRAPGREDPFRVAFAHELVLFLKSVDYPVPRLFGTRDEHNSLLQLSGQTYELFDFVRGERPTPDQRSTKVSGRALGRLHTIVRDFESSFTPPTGTYHGMNLASPLEKLPDSIERAITDADPNAVRAIAGNLAEAYDEARQRAAELGIEQWPSVIVHGDWHPGNLLLRDQDVVAVLDFDSARLAPRMIDVANAALQFSMRTGDIEQPTTWPEGISHRRIRALLRGYEQKAATSLSNEEIEALPWLIIEAMIVESVLPIAAAGRFAHLSGESFLAMVDEKVRWLRPRAAKLTSFLRSDDEEAGRSS